MNTEHWVQDYSTWLGRNTEVYRSYTHNMYHTTANTPSRSGQLHTCLVHVDRWSAQLGRELDLISLQLYCTTVISLLMGGIRTFYSNGWIKDRKIIQNIQFIILFIIDVILESTTYYYTNTDMVIRSITILIWRIREKHSCILHSIPAVLGLRLQSSKSPGFIIEHLSN